MLQRRRQQRPDRLREGPDRCDRHGVVAADRMGTDETRLQRLTPLSVERDRQSDDEEIDVTDVHQAKRPAHERQVLGGLGVGIVQRQGVHRLLHEGRLRSDLEHEPVHGNLHRLSLAHPVEREVAATRARCDRRKRATADLVRAVAGDGEFRPRVADIDGAHGGRHGRNPLGNATTLLVVD